MIIKINKSNSKTSNNYKINHNGKSIFKNRIKMKYNNSNNNNNNNKCNKYNHTNNNKNSK